MNTSIEKDINISVIGLGYVGMPIAIEFAKKYNVTGFDINEDKVNQYQSGLDVTGELGNDVIQNTTCQFTSDATQLQGANFHVISVPTPINTDKTPNLTPIISATKTVAHNLQKGSYVVYESTVYPGTTEEICIPILEQESGLTFGEDFKVGYSPERINPGDKENTVTSIVKVVSGSDAEALDTISSVYDSIIDAGVHRAESIKVAEASKVVENTQRDINIAFMNELSMVFNEMKIDTNSVLEASGTKWNFLNFSPGLVGGHCIGVDPYYFIYKAEQLGYHSQIILSGRKINDGMGKYVAQNIVKQLIKENQPVKGAKVGILGLAFKENCEDVRNTKVIDIINELEEYGVEVKLHDPIVNKEVVREEYGLDLVDHQELSDLNALVLAVPHNIFNEQPYTIDQLRGLYTEGSRLFVDIRNQYSREKCESLGYSYWSL